MKEYSGAFSTWRTIKEALILAIFPFLCLASLPLVLDANLQPNQREAQANTPISIPTDIDDTCAMDVTAALSKWITSVRDGTSANRTTLNFGANKCYRVDGSLKITGRQFLEFRGNGSTIDQHYTEGDYQRKAWAVKYGNDLKWSSFTVIGAHPEKQIVAGKQTTVNTYGYCASNPSKSCEWQAGWELSGVKRVVLSDNTTRNTYGDSVTVLWDFPENTVDSSNITIERQKVYGTGRQGISLVSGNNVTIRDSYIEGAAHQPIDIEPESATFPVHNVLITNNKFGQAYSSVVLASGTCTEVRDIQFTGNIFTAPNITSHPTLSAASPCVTAYRGKFNIQNNNFWIDEWGNDGDQVALFDDKIFDVTFNNNQTRFTCDASTPNCGRNQAAISTKTVNGWQIKDNNFSSFDWIWSLNTINQSGNLAACGNISSAGPNQPVTCQ